MNRKTIKNLYYFGDKCNVIDEFLKRSRLPHLIEIATMAYAIEREGNRIIYVHTK